MSQEIHDYSYWLPQIERLAGESATEEQLAQLEKLLLESPEARRAYVLWSQLQTDLRLVIRAEDSLTAAASDRISRVDGPRTSQQGSIVRPRHDERAPREAKSNRRSWIHRATLNWQSLAALMATMVTFAVLSMFFLMGLGIWTPNFQPSVGGEARAAVGPTFVARLTALRDVLWADPNKRQAELSYLREGQEIHFEVGLVEVTFRDGAKVLIEGPARFVTTAREQCELRQGRLFARIPSQGMGFVVSTPLAAAIDLGSNFGVSVDDSGTTEVHVFSGEIQLTVFSQQRVPGALPDRVMAESARRIRSGPSGSIVEPIRADASLFVHAIASKVLRSSGRAVQPMSPPRPAAGFLYDEPYSKIGDPISDYFGSQNGWMVAANASRPLRNTNDTPFSYSDNQAIDTTAGNSGIDYPVGSLSTVLRNSSAVAFQAWIKFQDGDLSSGTFTNRICTVHIDGDITVFMVSPNDLHTVSVAGRSTPSDNLQSMTTTRTLVPDQWNQIVAVLDFANDQIHVSLNGGPFETSQVEFGSEVLVPGQPTREDRIPSSPFYSYTGLIDEVAIWGSALSADHVAWLNQNSLRGIAKATTNRDSK